MGVKRQQRMEAEIKKERLPLLRQPLPFDRLIILQEQAFPTQPFQVP
jgi:hypothetical protein